MVLKNKRIGVAMTGSFCTYTKAFEQIDRLLEEGAIMEAIKMQPINLHKSRCLVLGYGRCAKVLAAKLKGMDAQVTVCARNKTARSLAKSFGLEVMDFTELKRRICQYDHILIPFQNRS